MRAKRGMAAGMAAVSAAVLAMAVSGCGAGFQRPAALNTALPCGAPIFQDKALRLTSAFGPRIHPVTGKPSVHRGADYAAPIGAPVRATAPGEVVMAGARGAYGMHVRIRHAGGFETRYAHLSRIDVRAGDEVPRGAMIGLVGSTGRSTGPHLHYEVRRDEKALDPEGWVAATCSAAAPPLEADGNA